MSRLNAPLEITNSVVRATFLYRHLSARTSAARDLDGTIRISFTEPVPMHAVLVTRSHPLPATLAEALIEGGARIGARPHKLGRVGAWATPAVKIMTTLALLAHCASSSLIHGRRETPGSSSQLLGSGGTDNHRPAGRALLETTVENLAQSAATGFWRKPMSGSPPLRRPR